MNIEAKNTKAMWSGIFSIALAVALGWMLFGRSNPQRDNPKKFWTEKMEKALVKAKKYEASGCDLSADAPADISNHCRAVRFDWAMNVLELSSAKQKLKELQ